MITYSKIKRYDDLLFADYLKLEGYSHSFLKSERNGIADEFIETDNSMIGKLVDGILTEPNTVDMSHRLYPSAKEAAAALRKRFGTILPAFQTQVSFTAEASYMGFTMKTKGRLDFLLPGHAVLDLKWTKGKNIDALIDFMGYKNQNWHYSKLANVHQSHWMIYSDALKDCVFRSHDCSSDMNDFWADKIIKFGTVN